MFVRKGLPGETSWTHQEHGSTTEVHNTSSKWSAKFLQQCPIDKWDQTCLDLMPSHMFDKNQQILL